MTPSSPAAAVARSAQDEKRFMPRWEVTRRALCQPLDAHQPLECLTQDITPTGGCLIAPAPIPTDKKLKLSIFLADDAAVQVKGQAVWRKKTPKGTLTGILFDKTSKKTQELILKHAFTIPAPLM